jgi:hypothetical protein
MEHLLLTAIAAFMPGYAPAPVTRSLKVCRFVSRILTQSSYYRFRFRVTLGPGKRMMRKVLIPKGDE